MVGAVAVTLSIIGCGGENSGPGSDVPEPGRYAYTFTGLNRELEPLEFRGTLILTYASEDSLAGRWEVAGYHADPLDGDRLTDHWFLMASTVSEGVASHQIFPGGDALPVECVMSYPATGGGTRDIAAECTLTLE